MLVTMSRDVRHTTPRPYGLMSIHYGFLRKGLMAGHTAPLDLQLALEERCEKVHKPSSAVLFRRGEKAFGMFVVFSGKVNLDFGVDSLRARSYGSGALVGLPATISRSNYSMTATVTEDAELGFLTFAAFDSLLCEHPDLYQPLLAILGERVIENNELQKSLLNRRQTAVASG
ncbi:MAG: cyclic nucleotide-binding domain-containing protein [Terriglobales bacterium]